MQCAVRGRETCHEDKNRVFVPHPTACSHVTWPCSSLPAELQSWQSSLTNEQVAEKVETLQREVSAVLHLDQSSLSAIIPHGTVL